MLNTSPAKRSAYTRGAYQTSHLLPLSLGRQDADISNQVLRFCPTRSFTNAALPQTYYIHSIFHAVLQLVLSIDALQKARRNERQQGEVERRRSPQYPCFTL